MLQLSNLLHRLTHRGHEQDKTENLETEAKLRQVEASLRETRNRVRGLEYRLELQEIRLRSQNGDYPGYSG